ncbi:MAG: hypothetical protein ABI838_02395 [Chloroflexota bacterium]
MKKSLLATTLVLFFVTACGAGAGNPINAVVGPKKAQDAALQQSEAKGVTKCSTSGNMDATLAELKKTDPTNYESTNKEWTKLKAEGATDAYFAIYASDTATCGKLSAGTNKAGTKILGSLVVEFKDTSAATAGYNGGAFGIDPKTSAGSGGKTGNATGLGPNSVSGYFSGTGFEFYIALWQRDKWLSYLLTEGFTEPDSSTMAKVVDSRL